VARTTGPWAAAAAEMRGYGTPVIFLPAAVGLRQGPMPMVYSRGDDMDSHGEHSRKNRL
jgi:hypothetical protein